MRAVRRRTPLADLLAERIRRNGPMTFADYMRECLYHPLYGYYSRAETRRFGDYYTSADVHPIFGRLLARQFAEMWERLEKPAEFALVEAGAGVGRLAAHILEWTEARQPDFHAALRYVAVERSNARRVQMCERLARYISAGRCEASVEIPTRISRGCVFSNELLDALPVHRVAMEADSLSEIFITLRGAELAEESLPLSTCAIPEYFATQRIMLQQEQQAEVGLEACDWITEVGRRLEQGYILTIDYGHEAPELYNERHMRGTLLAYEGHRASEEYYAAPGEQDLTAHINFTALEQWGRRVGLERSGYVSQAELLMALGQENEFADLYESGESETERLRARLLLKTLIYPEGMGERFHVLIQQKGTTGALLTGLRGIQPPRIA